MWCLLSQETPLYLHLFERCDFLTPRRQLTETLLLLRQLLTILGNYLRFGSRDIVCVCQLALQTTPLLLSLGDLFIEPLQFLTNVDHASQRQVDLNCPS